ncbi:hypothetical protein V8G54_001953 [Vigna mungo]|uniref:Uncharacterized protein n=1 Tax=Vigna mungo TaxID=3915 RepID=A0AAQ3S8P1_VIGMU
MKTRLSEVVQTVKDPKSIIKNRSDDNASLQEVEQKMNLDFILPKSAVAGNTSTPGRQPSSLNIQRVSSNQEKVRTSRSGRISFKGFKGKSQSYSGRDGEKYTVEPEVLMTKEIEWSNNLENSLRERDMRQGIDLATTLERIEKNFVISDPRLPDNPITPPPLDVPLKLIGKDPVAKDINWEDDGVLVSSIDMDIF